MYSIGSRVYNIVIALHGDWTHGEHSIAYINTESLCCTPEGNTILYVNSSLIKK